VNGQPAGVRSTGRARRVRTNPRFVQTADAAATEPTEGSDDLAGRRSRRTRTPSGTTPPSAA
jgi:hypothetical protein